ncbi:MAG TPA: GNAT family N-acetyltransferase [Aquaticitalea sp.]|nr:GNAT family N-acetyltransferase [Aquaticitalea sp.]
MVKPDLIADRTKQVAIKVAETGQDMKDFISFPYNLYHNNPYYVPPLKVDQVTILSKDQNPAFAHCESKYWLAYRKNKVVGRIAGIINHAFIDKWGKKYARFGWFDFEDDENVAQSLLTVCEAWARDQGMEAIHGPLGFSNFDPAGMLIQGFDQMATLATLYNYPYYVTHIEKAGYQKEIDWVEYKIFLDNTVPQKIEQLASIVRKRNKVRVIHPKNKQDIARYAHDIFEIINICYSPLHGMVELTEKQIEYYIKRYLPLIRKDFISLVVMDDGTLIAFGIVMPSLSKAMQKANGSLFPFAFMHLFMDMRQNDTGELCLIAVRPDYQGKGINALLMEEANKVFIQNKIFTAESNPELEDNKQIQSLWDYYKAQQHKRRRCYLKYL